MSVDTTSRLAAYLDRHGAAREDLDQAVHDALSALASEVNNTVLDGQVRTLIQAYGYNEARRLVFRLTGLADPGLDEMPAEPSEAELLDREAVLLKTYGKLVCPHCGFDGSTEAEYAAEPEAEAFRYVEDVSCWRPILASTASSLTVHGLYHTGECYDDGSNARVECRNCLGEFPWPHDAASIIFE